MVNNRIMRVDSLVSKLNLLPAKIGLDNGVHFQARAAVVPNRKKKALQGEIREHVLAGSAIFTDALKSVRRIG